MADYAADHVATPETTEFESLDLWVELHTHWRGHAARITSNGRHRAAIFRAIDVPLVQCQISVPRDCRRRFLPESWTDREDRLMRWLLDAGLIFDYQPPNRVDDVWGGAIYSISEGSPIPWVLPDGQSSVAGIPGRVADLEKALGPIPDERVEPLRDARELRSIISPSLLSRWRSGSPSSHTSVEDPEPAGDPRENAEAWRSANTERVMNTLLDALPQAVMARYRPENSHPGDDYGRVLAWLWLSKRENDTVALVNSLHTELEEHGKAPGWEEFTAGVASSLPKDLAPSERAHLLGEIEANSPMFRAPSQRQPPSPAG